jgi:outer membrane scaffolding protein for murein synthesis (MipA/OmpV family)
MVYATTTPCVTRLVCLACTVLFLTPAESQEVGEIPFFDATPGTAGLGGGIRFGQNLYLSNDSDDQSGLDLIPLYLYEGKYLFFRGTAAGMHIVKNESFELNLYTKYRFQELDPDWHSFYEGLNYREQTLDAGIQLGISRNWGEIKMYWITDTLDNHNGEEAQISYRYRFESGPWSISPFASVTWQDDDLTNYYFGVSDAEAMPGRPAYLPGKSQWLGFGLNTAWHMSDRIVLFGNVGFSGADSEVTDSPLVNESGLSQVFVGGTFLFGNTLRPDYIMDKERQGEWSWRVNYGYQADGNIVSEIDQGDFSKSSVVHTNVGGLTFSKLLAAGKRADFLGNVALFRHFEEDQGNDNFWSYAAYIAVRGKGYSPWSREEIFRWSFGFGMSYAENIPLAEQLKQESKDDNTSHFLSYLDMSLDYPLRRISRAKWLQRCYAGVSLVHRSGLFGSSDLFGDVSGGSDWITAHLECTRG